jgi:protease-4
VAEINLSDGIPEIHRAGLLGTPKKRALTDLLALLLAIESGKEEQIKGLMLVFGSMRPGFARAQEIGDRLAAVRKGGMPVVCHADEYANSSYWVAAKACDRIWVSPAGGMDTVGIAAQLLYARRLMDELKVDVDMLQVGKFKGAAEPFTRDGPSDEAKSSLMGTLKSIRGTWLEELTTARGGKVRDAAELGPYSPREAANGGLADQVGYLDEARHDAKTRAAVDQVVPRFGPGAKSSDAGGLVEIVRTVSGAGVGSGLPRVEVVRAIGGISMEASGGLFSDGDGISERELSRTLERLRTDDSAKSIVLRIDSPGGSALASDLLWHAIMELRKIKPVVVSIGDMAASGGYYLACAGTRIFAEPSSIVGSIGVVGGKFGIKRGLAHVGVTAEVLPASDAPGAAERAGYLSPFAIWDDSTRNRVLVTMTSVYDLFVARVAEGRSIPREKVEAFAEGKIFAGRESLGLGMIDELGGLSQAIAYARRAGGLDEDAPIRVVGEETGLEKMLELDGEDEAKSAGPAAGDWLVRSVATAAAPDLLFFAKAYEPLVRGEHTLVAVPFAILIR